MIKCCTVHFPITILFFYHFQNAVQREKIKKAKKRKTFILISMQFHTNFMVQYAQHSKSTESHNVKLFGIEFYKCFFCFFSSFCLSSNQLSTLYYYFFSLLLLNHCIIGQCSLWSLFPYFNLKSFCCCYVFWFAYLKLVFPSN